MEFRYVAFFSAILPTMTTLQTPEEPLTTPEPYVPVGPVQLPIHPQEVKPFEAPKSTAIGVGVTSAAVVLLVSIAALDLINITQHVATLKRNLAAGKRYRARMKRLKQQKKLADFADLSRMASIAGSVDDWHVRYT